MTTALFGACPVSISSYLCIHAIRLFWSCLLSYFYDSALNTGKLATNACDEPRRCKIILLAWLCFLERRRRSAATLRAMAILGCPRTGLLASEKAKSRYSDAVRIDETTEPISSMATVWSPACRLSTVVRRPGSKMCRKIARRGGEFSGRGMVSAKVAIRVQTSVSPRFAVVSSSDHNNRRNFSQPHVLMQRSTSKAGAFDPRAFATASRIACLG